MSSTVYTTGHGISCPHMLNNIVNIVSAWMLAGKALRCSHRVVVVSVQSWAPAGAEFSNFISSDILARLLNKPHRSVACGKLQPTASLPYRLCWSQLQQIVSGRVKYCTRTKKLINKSCARDGVSMKCVRLRDSGCCSRCQGLRKYLRFSLLILSIAILAMGLAICKMVVPGVIELPRDFNTCGWYFLSG